MDVRFYLFSVRFWKCRIIYGWINETPPYIPCKNLVNLIIQVTLVILGTYSLHFISWYEGFGSLFKLMWRYNNTQDNLLRITVYLDRFMHRSAIKF